MTFQEMQPWLTVLGLSLDLVGFFVLAYNLWDTLVLETETLLRRALTAPDPRRSWKAEDKTDREQQKEMAENADRSWSHWRGSIVRKKTTLLAIWAILMGFIFQIIGAWPT